MIGGLSLIESTAASLLVGLLNSLWQGAVLFASAWLFLRTFRFLNATTRYAVWIIALVFLILLPFSREWIVSRETTRSEPTAPWIDEVPQASRARSELFVLDRSLSALDENGTESLGSPRELVAGPAAAEDDGMSSVSPTLWLAPIELAPGRWTLVAALGWIGIASLMLARILWSYVYLHRLKRASRPVDVRFQPRLDAWRKLAGSRRAVELRCSDRITGPVAAGLSRPVILLPCSLIEKLSVEELDQVGLHEMAHLARWDDWTNFVQKCIEAIFFFHPAVHGIGRQLNLEREIACDDWVIFRTGKPKPYAACLTRLVELTGRMDVPALAPGSWTTTKEITRRIEMSLNRSRNFTPRLSKASLFVTVAFFLFAAVAFARISPLVRAAEQEEKTQEKATPEKETAPKVNEEVLPEENEEESVAPDERRLTPEQRMDLEMAIAREKREQLREIEDRQRAEREVLKADEAERRARAEQRLEAERQRYHQDAELDELRARVYAQRPLFIDEPVLIGREEEPAIAEDELIELMSEIVRNDSDSSVRAAALESIGRLRSEAASDALAALYDSIPDLELKKKALSSMGYSRKLTPKVRAKLVEIATTSTDDELREAALRVLARRPDNEGAEALISIYDSTTSADTKKTVIEYLGYNRSPSAVDKLKAIARRDSDPDLRLEAVRSLGRLHDGLLLAVPEVEPGLLVQPVRPPSPPPVLPEPIK